MGRVVVTRKNPRKQGPIVLVALIAILSLMLSGCSLPFGKRVFTDQDSARSYLLEKLRNKYGREFAMSHENYLDNGYTFTGGIHPVDDPEQDAVAKVTRTGRFEDSWAVWLYADDLGSHPAQVCKEFQDDLLSCSSEPYMKSTTKTWNPATTSVEEFIKQARPVNNITVEFNSTDEDVIAPLILAMIDRFDQSPIMYTFEVRQNGWGAYHHRSSESRPSLQDIKDELS